MPSAKAPSNSAGAIATDRKKPRTSVNHIRTKRTSRSSIARNTNSVCLSTTASVPRRCNSDVTHSRQQIVIRNAAAKSSRCRDLGCSTLEYAEAVPQLRIAMAQINTTVGDISANADLIVGWAERAYVAGADLVLFPEMALTGYPVEELALRQSFVEASRISIARVASRLHGGGFGDLVAVVGYLDRTEDPDHPKGGQPLDAAAVLHQGRVITSYAKHHLPNYGVFDEYRYFKPGNELHVLRICGIDVAVAICEDLWQDGGPVAATREAGAGLLAVINASPYERDKDDVRGELVARRAREAGCPLAYVNLVGGQDELVFDGDTMISDADGTIAVRALQFVEDLVVTDLELAAASAPVKTETAEGTVPAEPGQSG